MRLPHKAEIYVLHRYPQIFMVIPKQSTLTDFGLQQLRRLVALSWRKMGVPSIHVWIKEMASCIVLERLTYMTKGKCAKFSKMCEKL